MNKVDVPDSLERKVFRAIAKRLVKGGHPVKFSVAVTASQKSAIYSLRYAIIQARNWGDLSQYPHAQERDCFDDDAIHIQGLADGNLVASARLIFPKPNQLLPIQHCYSIDLEPVESFVEIGRVIVHGDHRQASRSSVFAALIGSVLIQAFDASFFSVLAVASEGMLRLYRRLGICSEVIGPPMRIFDEERFPVSIDVARSLPCLEQFVSRNKMR